MGWKQYQVSNELQITWSLIWTLIKKRLTKKPFHLTISFHYKEWGDMRITGAQVEFD